MIQIWNRYLYIFLYEVRFISHFNTLKVKGCRVKDLHWDPTLQHLACVIQLGLQNLSAVLHLSYPQPQPVTSCNTTCSNVLICDGNLTSHFCIISQTNRNSSGAASFPDPEGAKSSITSGPSLLLHGSRYRCFYTDVCATKRLHLSTVR